MIHNIKRNNIIEEMEEVIECFDVDEEIEIHRKAKD